MGSSRRNQYKSRTGAVILGKSAKKPRGACRMALLKSALAVVATLIVAGTAARAEGSPMPEEIAWKLLELGRAIDLPKTALLWEPLQEKEPYRGVKIERDVKYGAADRNLLDVFTPETASSPRPVLIFVPGGGFVAGNKRTSGSPFYDNIMLWAVKNGFVGVNVTYRLAPQAVWPAGAEDLAAAVQWVADKINERGGGPAGAILLSGIYDLTATPLADPERAYFGADPAGYAEQSSLQGLLATKTPLMMVATELDPPRFVQQFELLKEAVCKGARGCAHAIMLPQHSHVSEVYSINTADTRLADEILDFVKIG